MKYSGPTQPQLGHQVTSSGLKPDPDKVEAIQKMRDLNISRECDEYVYSSPLGHIRAPIIRHHGPTTTTAALGSKLAVPTTKRSTRSNDWSPRAQSEVLSGLAAWSSHTTSTSFPGPFGGRGKGQKALGMRLRLYDSTKQRTLQDGALLAFPSRALTEAETRDKQNEKEMQAVVYASSRAGDHGSVSRNTSRYSLPRRSRSELHQSDY